MQISVLFYYFTHSVGITKIKSLFCKKELFFTPLLFSKEQKMAYHAIYLLLKLGYTPKKAAIVSGGIFCSDREENYRLFQNRADRFSLYFLYIVEASSANNHLGEISRSKLEKKCNKKLNFLRINFTLWQLFVYISNGHGGFDNGRILQLINFISIEFLIYVVMIQSPVNKKEDF